MSDWENYIYDYGDMDDNAFYYINTFVKKHGYSTEIVSVLKDHLYNHSQESKDNLRGYNKILDQLAGSESGIRNSIDRLIRNESTDWSGASEIAKLFLDSTIRGKDFDILKKNGLKHTHILKISKSDIDNLTLFLNSFNKFNDFVKSLTINNSRAKSILIGVFKINHGLLVGNVINPSLYIDEVDKYVPVLQNIKTLNYNSKIWLGVDALCNHDNELILDELKRNPTEFLELVGNFQKFCDECDYLANNNQDIADFICKTIMGNSEDFTRGLRAAAAIRELGITGIGLRYVIENYCEGNRMKFFDCVKSKDVVMIRSAKIYERYGNCYKTIDLSDTDIDIKQNPSVDRKIDLSFSENDEF